MCCASSPNRAATTAALNAPPPLSPPREGVVGAGVVVFVVFVALLRGCEDPAVAEAARGADGCVGGVSSCVGGAWRYASSNTTNFVFGLK